MLSRVLGPLVRVLMFLTNALVRMFGGAPVKRGPFVTEDELRLLVEVGEQEGVLEEEEREMIHNVFELADTTVHEVMVPRPDMITVEADATLDDAMKIIVEGGQSRIPVYADSIDDIIGVLYAKDLLRVLTLNERPPSVRSLVRQAYFVPESKRLDDLLREMQQQRVHMAIVVDEYGWSPASSPSRTSSSRSSATSRTSTTARNNSSSVSATTSSSSTPRSASTSWTSCSTRS